MLYFWIQRKSGICEQNIAVKRHLPYLNSALRFLNVAVFLCRRELLFLFYFSIHKCDYFIFIRFFGHRSSTYMSVFFFCRIAYTFSFLLVQPVMNMIQPRINLNILSTTPSNNQFMRLAYGCYTLFFRSFRSACLVIVSFIEIVQCSQIAHLVAKVPPHTYHSTNYNSI